MCSSEQPVRKKRSSHAATTPKYAGIAAIYALVCGAGLSGCGHTLYAIQVSSASSKLAEARELGAEQFAPYEYYMAKEHLEKARSEASEADYGDAATLSESAEQYADKAIALSRDAHRGAGR